DAETALAHALGAPLESVQAALAVYVGQPLATIELSAATPAAAEVPVVEAAANALVETRKGVLLLDVAQPKAAERHLARALEDDPSFVPAHEAMARLALEIGRWREAQVHVRAVLDAEPERPLALYQEARARVREAAARGVPLSDEDTAKAVAA